MPWFIYGYKMKASVDFRAQICKTHSKVVSVLANPNGLHSIGNCHLGDDLNGILLKYQDSKSQRKVYDYDQTSSAIKECA